MVNQQKAAWEDYCHKAGRSACGSTSYYPTVSGMVAQKGDDGVAGYVAQKFAEGAIGYVNYSYALNAGFPVAKMLNAAGYYTEPTPNNVAVSLLKAQINTDASSQDYLTQQLDGVYSDPDPRTYPLSSYSYMILPTKVQGQFSEAKGKTLGAFSYYAMCQGQQESGTLGYSPMPINLVQASFDQIKKIPGVVVQNITIQDCKNPTFSADGRNLLAETAPQPQDCDKQGTTQCATGTGGAKKTSTPVKAGTGGSSTAAGGTKNGPSAAKGGTGAVANNSSAAGAAPGATADQLAAGIDPVTGDVVSTDSGVTGSVSALPTTLAAESGWSHSQTLIVLALLLTLALVFAPGVAARLLANRDRS
jgi:phosphate transport system substrate-binding protein